MIKLDLEKAEEPETKLPTLAGSLKKQESFRKASISALLTMPKPLTVWITINCGKLWKRWEYQTTWPASWEICMQVGKQQLEQLATVAYLTYMQSTSWEMLGWMKHKLDSRLPGEISSQVYRWYHPYDRKWRRTKEPLDKNERGKSKSWLKAKHSEN